MNDDAFHSQLLTLLRHLEATSDDVVPIGRVLRMVVAQLHDEVRQRIEDDRKLENGKHLLREAVRKWYERLK